VARPQAPQIPAPESVLGFKPGTERKLADYEADGRLRSPEWKAVA
jgi:hypothetical protein